MPSVTCPNCRKPVTAEHFRGNEECLRVARKFWATVCASQRKTITHAGGRPSLCGLCGKCRNCKLRLNRLARDKNKK